jgi:hypothetical protein
MSFAAATTLGLGGCATDEAGSDYDYNTFYIGQRPPPRHVDKRVNLDFFDRVCDKVSKNEFNCYYTDQ